MSGYPRPEKVRVSVSLPRHVVDRLDAYALTVERKRWQVVRDLLTRGAERMIEDDTVRELVELREQRRLFDAPAGRETRNGLRVVDGDRS